MLQIYGIGNVSAPCGETSTMLPSKGCVSFSLVSPPRPLKGNLPRASNLFNCQSPQPCKGVIKPL